MSEATRAGQSGKRSWMYTLIWALCTPGIVVVFLGMPVTYLDLQGKWHSQGSAVLSSIERIADGAMIVTLVGGWLLTGAALVLLIVSIRSRKLTERMKKELSILVGLSGIATIWMLVAASHVWNG